MKHGEHISRGAADIDANHIDIFSSRDRLDNHADCGWRRNNGRSSPRDQFLVARRLRHDMFEEQVVNFVTGGYEVFLFQNRTDVVGHD